MIDLCTVLARKPLLRGMTSILVMLGISCSMIRAKKKPLEVVPKLPSLTDATCERLDLSLKPRIFGWSATTRQLIERRLHRGALGVRYVKRGCTVQLIPQPACKLNTSYQYRRVYGEKEILISSSGALWQELPMVAKKYAKGIASRRSIKVFAETSAIMSLPADQGVHLDALKSKQCKNVTHIVQSAALGRLASVEGETDDVEDYTGKTMPKSPLSIVEFSGDSGACRETRLIRPPACRSPIRFFLLPVKRDAPVPKLQTVKIPAGTFLRGPSKVRVDLKAFDIDRREVTAKAYDACIRQRKCTSAKKGRFCTSGIIGKEDHPINCVTWRQARAFCRSRNMRLPTEAEWEKAARGVDGRTFVWGEEWPPPARIANFADRSAKKQFPYWGVIENYKDRVVGTAPVDAFERQRNAYGLTQMAGNVAVWAEDWYRARLPTRPHSNPRGPRRGPAKVVRGSTFGHRSKDQLYTHRRDFYDSRTSSMYIGVRCAR